MKILFSALLFACLTMAQIPAAGGPAMADADITVTVNKSIVLDHPGGIRRVSITNPDIAEAVAVSSLELLLNGKSAGDTSLILWDKTGRRIGYDVHVLASGVKLDVVRDQLHKEVGPDASIAIEDGSVFLRGTVQDPIAAERAAKIAGTLGKVVNLLRVVVPPEEPQILLKVRFATVSRTITSQAGFNFFTAMQKGISNSTTGQFGQNPSFGLSPGQAPSISFSDLLNLFYFDPSLNVGAFLQALEAKSMAQILAEPNLLTASGHEASFLAGGEFPFPTLQGGGSGVGQITIQFKEFGIKLNFLPTITPQGMIHMVVTPEVSSLDYANGLTISGYTIPGLDTRRVTTEVDLRDRQSFVIAGLMDNQTTQQLNKIPGIGDIPVLGKLFQSRSVTKNDDQLLVFVTPELVRPIPADVKPPELKLPLPFISGALKESPRNPGSQVTGPAAPLPKLDSLPVEEMQNSGASSAPAASNAPPPLMVVQPVTLTPASAPGTQPNTQTNPQTSQPNTSGSNH